MISKRILKFNFKCVAFHNPSVVSHDNKAFMPLIYTFLFDIVMNSFLCRSRFVCIIIITDNMIIVHIYVHTHITVFDIITYKKITHIIIT